MTQPLSFIFQGLDRYWEISFEDKMPSAIKVSEEKPSENVEFPEWMADYKRWMEMYFQGVDPDVVIDIPLLGTDFQNSVWQGLMRIPFGQTTTYGELARAIGKPRAARAVGLALNRNPIPLLIPCHRVIGKGGTLTGYALGMDVKKALLTHENIAFESDQ